MRPEFAAGYFKLASHELLAVEECPISSPLINRGIAALWQAGRAGKAVEGVREVEFFANADDTKLLIEMLCAPEARRAAVRAWAEELCAAMPGIVGVAAFREPQKGLQEPLVTVGASELTYQTKTSAYRVSAGAFFQTNRFLIDELVNIVTASRSGELALDLYAGAGLFSTALACDFHHIVSVESSQTAARDLQYNLPINGKAIHAETGQYVNRTGSAGAGDAWASLKAGSPAQSCPGRKRVEGREGRASFAEARLDRSGPAAKRIRRSRGARAGRHRRASPDLCIVRSRDPGPRPASAASVRLSRRGGASGRLVPPNLPPGKRGAVSALIPNPQSRNLA